ncbi:MAG: thioesterase family protein [Actinomycetaceae bacterium]|nr:thioesterase family protein [Actinomycetaceae bacterium]
MTAPIDVPLHSHEPVASVLRALALTETGDDTFHAWSLPQVRRVYGGQVLAQASLAAAATVEDDDRLLHSLHASFLRGGDPAETFELRVDRLRRGRSFTSREIRAGQAGREILSMSASFQAAEDGPSFSGAAPQVAGPNECRSALEIFREMDHPVGRFLGKTAAFDVRHVGTSLYTAPDPDRLPTQALWMQPRSPIPAGASQHVHRALLAYVIDQVMLEPAMRVLGLCWMSPGMSAASLDHAMWFHRDVDINDWLLYEGSCSNVNNGRTLTRTRVWTRDGVLVAEAEQQGMLRMPTEDHAGSQRWGFGVDPVTGKPAVGSA